MGRRAGGAIRFGTFAVSAGVGAAWCGGRWSFSVKFEGLAAGVEEVVEAGDGAAVGGCLGDEGTESEEKGGVAAVGRFGRRRASRRVWICESSVAA